MSTTEQAALYREIAAETHPMFCGGDPAGCDGVHISRPVQRLALDKDGTLPVHLYAIFDEATGTRKIEALFEFERGPVSVYLNPGQARDLADALVDVADMLKRPWSTWSWTIEQVEAYAEAMRSFSNTERR